VRILYVEDNPANLFLVQRVARMGNHEVINYSEGQVALDNFPRDKPDLILMDIQLPGKLTGLDVVKALRDAGHKTPIIAVTAYAMIGDRERCLQVGCSGYIAKPLPVGELVDIIKQYEGQLAAPSPAPPAAGPKPEATPPPEKAASPTPEPEKPPALVSSPVFPAESKGLEKPVSSPTAVSSSQKTPSTLSSNHH
jgi:two-component system, cell cycle response regulator DivK